MLFIQLCFRRVSTHSRPKAAGYAVCSHAGRKARFNSQPPEGGWNPNPDPNDKPDVSTHSRPKAAGVLQTQDQSQQAVSTHSRPKAAGATSGGQVAVMGGFNSQPPEGGWGRA